MFGLIFVKKNKHTLNYMPGGRSKKVCENFVIIKMN